jgi:CheY-like chemotaxis protein
MGIEPEFRFQDQPSSGTPPLAFRILVAEDNLTNQKVILRQLQSLSYTADVVSDGEAAIAATAQVFYHIVLMDCRLPKVDGYTATRLIRQRERAAQTPRTIIIALTANDDLAAEHEARAAGMDDFLTKPLRRETLFATLTKWGQWHQQSKQGLTLVEAGQHSLMMPEPTLLALHFNLDCLHQLSDYNQEFEQELLQLYLDDTQAQIQQLLQANCKQHFLQVERTAHHIRGASASVGAFQLEALAEKLEQQAQQHPSDTATLIEQLRLAFEQIRVLFYGKAQS